MYELAAVFTDKMLKGGRPEDTPAQQPTRYELVINSKTANALGVRLPSILLAEADEVIE
jgi:putative ABC transport system substrate-binding protein